MLNWNDLLFYVKGRLSLPSSFIEKTDNDLKKWITLTSIPDYSRFIPDKEICGIDPRDENYKSEETNYYLILDEEDLPIYGIGDVYYGGGGYMATGHPYFPVSNFTDIKSWALAAMKSNMLKPLSYWSYTATFYPPNRIRVIPSITEEFAVFYEREQPHDLRRVPETYKREFMDLALADVMLWIGGMRSHYGDGRITTPFGEIPLNGEVLKSEGLELKRETIDKLREITMPGIVVDIE